MMVFALSTMPALVFECCVGQAGTALRAQWYQYMAAVRNATEGLNQTLQEPAPRATVSGRENVSDSFDGRPHSPSASNTWSKALLFPSAWLLQRLVQSFRQTS
jgi:hypothetical protein